MTADDALSPASLAAARAICDAATPGPWYALPAYDDRSGGIATRPDREGYGADIVRTDSGIYPPVRSDAEFIALARDLLPLALAEVERLRALPSRWRAEAALHDENGDDQWDMATSISLHHCADQLDGTVP